MKIVSQSKLFFRKKKKKKKKRKNVFRLRWEPVSVSVLLSSKRNVISLYEFYLRKHTTSYLLTLFRYRNDVWLRRCVFTGPRYCLTIKFTQTLDHKGTGYTGKILDHFTFPVHQSHSDKGSTLTAYNLLPLKGVYSKRKEFVPLGSKFFPYRVERFSEGKKNNSDTIVPSLLERGLL